MKTSPRSPTSSPPSAPATPVSEFSAEEELKALKEEENVYNFDSEEQPTETEDKYSLFLEFLKQIRPGMEMYRLSVPTFILQPISLLEKLSIYSSPNDLLEGIEHQKIPELRFITVTKWILSNWRTIPRIGLEGIKPYNSILGEQFECSWNAEDGSKYMFIAEQVSHHPPISGFFMYNEKKQFYYYGSCYPQTHFSWNSFGTTMSGDFIVELPAFKERYVVKHPPVYANGIIWGKKVIEIGEELSITCEENGFKASIKFESGNNNQLEGTIYDKSGAPVYTVKGQVNKTVHLKSNQTKKDTVFYDSTKIKRAPKIIKPVAEQKTNESRRNWHRVTVALRKGDHDAASLQKYLIEERERKIRKERQERGETWTPKLFTLVNDHWIYNNSPASLKISKPVANATTSSKH